jgi:hypothetical protein
MVTAKVCDCLEVGRKLAHQPRQLDIAARFRARFERA